MAQGDPDRAPAPVCVAVGGRDGAATERLIAELTMRLRAAGPIVIGGLDPSNAPALADADTAADADLDGDDGARAYPGGAPVDLVVHLAHGAVTGTDRAALAAHRARGVATAVVLGLRGARPVPSAAAATTLGCGGAVVPVIVEADEIIGADRVAAVVRAGAGELLAARCDRILAGREAAAIESPDRSAAERRLTGPPARRLRAIGAGSWDRSGGDAARALALARWYADAAAADTDRDRRDRARAWSRRYIDRAIALGAPVHGAPGVQTSFAKTPITAGAGR